MMLKCLSRGRETSQCHRELALITLRTRTKSQARGHTRCHTLWVDLSEKHLKAIDQEPQIGVGPTRVGAQRRWDKTKLFSSIAGYGEK